MKKLLLTILLIIATTYGATAQIKCTVVGRVVNRPQSLSMTLARPYEDLRTKSQTVEIKDSTFTFTIQGTHPECYELVFEDESNQGSWQPINFCTTNGVIEMVLYPQNEHAKNQIIGGTENQKLLDFNAYREQIYYSHIEPMYIPLRNIKWEDQITPAARALADSISDGEGELRNRLIARRTQMRNQGTFYTAQVNEIRRQIDSVGVAAERMIDHYEMANLSIASYSWLVSSLSYFNSFAERYKGEGSALDYLSRKYAAYAKAYPTHPYTKLCADMLNSVAQVVVGGRYIDFTAPDLQGKMVKLSEQIAGKIAIVDLWASWCAPCRASSISFLPIYEQYKDRDFTIVGVAREKDNDGAMRRAIDKDGYQWLNLVEINDRASIWRTYGINNSGGGVYVVDRDGTILAINPTADEVRAILDTRL